jgi:hypothetical protein
MQETKQTTEDRKPARATVQGLTRANHKDDRNNTKRSYSFSCIEREASPSTGWREVYKEMEVWGW